MSKTSYFSNFPIINYNGQQVVDITERAKFSNSSLSNPNLFYPYDLSCDERAEQFSYRYYKDPFLDWVVYLGNNFLDPYYNWYLNDDAFQNFIIKKYGSIQLAQSKVSYFQNNWYNYQGNISLSDYDALPYTLYKYYQPVYGSSNKIIAYSRINSNDTINTNSIRSMIVNSNTFIQDEVCIFSLAGTTLQGQVVSIANNVLYIQHIIGNSTSFVEPLTITGSQSNTIATFSSYTNISDSLLPEEVVYWSPVTYFDMETNNNESHKTIQVLDSNYATSAVSSLQSVLQD